MQLDAAVLPEHGGTEHYFANEKDFMADLSFMGVNILHDQGRAFYFNVNAQLLFEFAHECGLPLLAELDTASKRANTLKAALVIKDLCSKELVFSPVQSKCFDFDVRRRSPLGWDHALSLANEG